MEKVSYYNFHNILKVKIVKCRKSVFDNYLDKTFYHYEADKLDNIDLSIFIGKVLPDKENCFIVDGRYYVKKDYIFYENTYKYARWKVEIKGLESAETEVNIQSNVPGRVVFPGETIYSLIRYKLCLKGYPLIHGSGVSLNNHGYLFSARPGTGKTITTVNLVKKGFDYYSDDSVILGKREFFSFIVPFNLRFTYDVEKLLGIHFSPSIRFQLFWKRMLYFLTLKKVSLFTTLKAEDVFKDAIKEKTNISKVYVMMQGWEFSVKKYRRREDIAKKIFLNLWFESPELISMHYAYNFVFPDSSLANFWNNTYDSIFQAIENVQYYEVILPFNYSEDIFERFYEEALAV